MKRFVKSAVHALSIIVVAPCWGLFFLWAQLVGGNRALMGFTQAFSLLPGMTGVYLRRAFYSGVFPVVGADSVISFGVLFSHCATTIGRAAYIGPYCVIGDAEIGDDCLIGSQVSIMNGTKQHGIERLDIPVREQPGHFPRITIGRDSWIGDRAIVMADVGKHCVVGAGAVVTKPVEDFAIVVGNPARKVGSRE